MILEAMILAMGAVAMYSWGYWKGRYARSGKEIPFDLD